MKTVRIGSLLLSLLLLLAACTVEIGSRVPDPSTSTSNTVHSPTTTLPTRDLEVRVLDAETRAAVPGIHVQLSDPAGADVGVEVTNAEGVARWFDIAVESVSLSASTRCEAALDCEVYMTLGSVAVDLPIGVTSTDLEVVPFSHNLTTAGVIRGNEVWSSQVHLTGSVAVPTGALLVIEPGTTVTVAGLDDGSADDVLDELDKPDGIVVWSEGLVVAAGTPESPVRFRAADETDSWGGLIGAIDARHVGIEGSSLVRLGEGSTMSHSSITSGQVWIAAGAEFDHNAVNAIGTSVELGGASLHHNRFIGAGQAACVRFDGLSGNAIRNSIFVDCPLVAESRPIEQPKDDDPSPLVIENNTFVASEGAQRPAVAIDNEYVEVLIFQPDVEQFDTVQVVFRNNLVYGPWPEGFFLGSRPIRSNSQVRANGFFGIEARVEYDYNTDNHFTYGGTMRRPGLFDLHGALAMSMAWRDHIGRHWGDSARIDDLHDDPMFVDAENGDFHLSPSSPAIDAGHSNIRNADGGASDLGAYGGPDAGAIPTAAALSVIAVDEIEAIARSAVCDAYLAFVSAPSPEDRVGPLAVIAENAGSQAPSGFDEALEILATADFGSTDVRAYLAILDGHVLPQCDAAFNDGVVGAADDDTAATRFWEAVVAGDRDSVADIASALTLVLFEPWDGYDPDSEYLLHDFTNGMLWMQLTPEVSLACQVSNGIVHSCQR